MRSDHCRRQSPVFGRRGGEGGALREWRRMIDTLRRASAIAAMLALFGSATAPAQATMTPLDRAIPHYDHILVIVEENKDYTTIMEGTLAPNIVRLAKTYGTATQMFGERHPSQPNYVAMLGGDTFGIADDRPHIVDKPHLGTQLRAKGLDWRAYLEDLPAPGWMANNVSPPPGQYADKHTGFTNFKSTHDMSAAEKAAHLVGFDALHADLRSGKVPAFAYVIPNLCNDMHGVTGVCNDGNTVVMRGDAIVAGLVHEIQASPIWTKPGTNTAIVITWDENGSFTPESCCVKDANNPGGGRVATVVVTNHGPAGVADPTPYDHYSLLRTIEDAFGLDHLVHADDATVLPMVPLFAVPAPAPAPTPH
jgi:phospholipase C